MKKTLSISIAAIALALGFSACQEEEFGYTARDINYTTNFVSTFGLPDTQQDWSTIAPVKLNVAVPSDGVYTLYVTSKPLNNQEQKNYLVAHYDQIVGDGSVKTLNFDYPKGYKHAYVSLFTEGMELLKTEHIVINEGAADAAFSNISSTSTTPSTRATNDGNYNLTKPSYVIALEDLGGSLDWDFNDVVFAIKYTAGEREAEFELRAAGGTLPAAIKFARQTISFDGKTDVHEAFGDTEGDIRVNVEISDAYVSEKVYKQIKDKKTTVTTLPKATVIVGSTTMSELLAQVSIQITQTSGEQTTIAAPRNYADKAADGANVPQAILIGKDDWQWPAEGQSIADAYSDFPAWVTDASLTDWYGQAWLDEPVDDPNSIPAGEGETPTEAQAPRR